ncbi:tripartite tricarboxylate transporter TctB family protein [Clostridium sp.]|uniref:tripartite tricarboxylate transporter TctB family protein n=1 Tax=Clostridium sp. TaxID=1506 RepID=UPI003D6D249B
MEKNTLRKYDLLFSIVLMIFAIFVAINGIVLTIQGAKMTGVEWYSSAGIMPIIIAFFTMICAISLYKIAKKDGANFEFLNGKNMKNLFAEKSTQNTLFIIALLGTYIYVLLRILPYTLATFLFLFVFIAFFKGETKKELIVALIVSIVTTALLAYGFGSLAQIPLP